MRLKVPPRLLAVPLRAVRCVEPRTATTRPNGAGAAFTCLGPVTYVSHVSNRPMQVTWKLEHLLPEALLETSQLVAAA